MRVVLQGEVNSPTFVTKDKDVQSMLTQKSFVMNGGWPHYMTNTFDDWKYTICLEHLGKVEILMNMLVL